MIGMLGGYRCDNCGTNYLFESAICSNCTNGVIESTKFRGEGTVITCTTIHVPPERFKDEAPYMVVLVDLDKGPKLIGRLKKGESVGPGMRVICSEFDGDESITVESFSSDPL